MAVKRKTTRRTTRKKKTGGHGLLYSLIFFLIVAVTASCVLGGPEKVAEAPAETAQEETAAETVSEKVTAAEEKIESFFGGEKKEKKTEEKKPAEKKKAASVPEKSTAAPAAKTETKKTEKPAAEPKKETAKAPAEKLSGRLAVVIDDAGRDLASQRVYEKMGIPLTLAVMPNQSHTSEAAAEWASYGLPVIIHQPMESVSGSGMEPIVLLTSMSAEAKKSMLADSMRQIPQAVGMNNHQGSKATIDRATMNTVMQMLSAKGMFFLDSATNTTTEADSAAAAYGVRYARNELFVDNSTDIEEIKAMIRKGARRASANGTAIIIGHCRPNTAEAFRQVVPELRAAGIEFIYVSKLLH